MEKAPAPSASTLRSGLRLSGLMLCLVTLASINTTLPNPERVASASAPPPLGMTFTVTVTDDAGSGSLREAIISANANPGPDMIAFDIAGAGVRVISPASPLPPITGPVTIDGYTQTGSSRNTLPDADNAVVLIELNGAGAGPGVNGLTINAGGSTVRGLRITRFSFSGILIQTAGGNTIEGNFIVENSSRGIAIEAGASNNMIGGITPDARNVISGNGSQGVRILGGSSDNSVQGNFIGIDASGLVAAGNVNEGVFLNTPDNVVGGMTPGARNIISGSLNASGVALVGSGATGNLVQGNYIGTDATGRSALGNRQEGILIDLGASNNLIGGAPSAGGNVISGNRQNGIVLGFTSAVNVNGLISPVNGNRITGNFIGTQADGVSPLGNGQDGISLFSGNDNVIGGVDGGGNVIAFNQFSGVEIGSGSGNAILSNSIFSNGGPGIDLSTDGITENDPCDPDQGANGQQNFPILTAFNFGPETVTIQGAINSAPNTSYLVQFFGNSACDATGFGEGATLIGSTVVTTGAGCIVTFEVSFPSINPGAVITATATDPQGNTSEFSECLLAPECVDETPPAITCPADINVVVERGLLSRAVDYPRPAVIDDCPDAIIVECVPPSGAAFPLGVSTVNCRASDLGGNTSACSFLITVLDAESPAITCPPNFAAEAPAGRCAVVVNYPLPDISGSPVGTIVACLPPPGAAFPVGVTRVTCVANSPAGASASCSFTVTISGAAQARVMLENGGNALEFGPVTPRLKPKKKPRNDCDCSATFMVENTGCEPLALDLPDITRMGSDVDSGRIGEPDDRQLFSLKVVNPDGSERDLQCGDGPSCIIIEPGRKLTFRVVFNPALPGVFAGKTRGLAAAEVLPELIRSRISFGRAGGSPVIINLTARLSTRVLLLDPERPRRPARVRLDRAGDELIVTYGIYDSNLDVISARYEFFDARGRQVGPAIDVPLAQEIRGRDITAGQIFFVRQRFSGAQANPSITSVRVTVFDGESSASVTGP